MKNSVFILMLLVAVSSCKNKPDQSTHVSDLAAKNDTSTLSKATTGISAENKSNTSWVDDLKDFRQALYSKDVAKLKTYFSFPVGDDNWGYPVQFTADELKERKAKYTNPSLLYEKDFERYYDQIFDKDLLKSIMKLKTASLLQKHEAETQEFNEGDFNFKLLANCYEEDKTTLHLNLSYTNNAVDENGDPVSEGEHNKIYVFDILDGKKLRFQRIVFAG
ncbi:hypothetical protein [Pedobacter agri]|uniref:hypothetical protein n=1 Tax=Pedobacter agri TaxID=454586 RepID=UPI00292CB2A1|nr:hypothetical protein [Pedobacter agri]